MSLIIDTGKVSEYRAAAVLLNFGLVPCWPSTEGQPYDMIVDTKGGPKRIQIKGTAKSGTKFEADLRMRDGKRRRRKYTKNDIDIVLFHIFELEAWYIFPIEEVDRRVTVSPAKSDCKYRKYLEAWHLLDPRIKGE